MSAGFDPHADGVAAREFVLGRIRRALSDVPGIEKPEDVPILREYRTVETLPRSEVIALFIDRLMDYKAMVTRVKLEGLPASIASACARRGIKRLVVPADLPSGWVPEGVSILRDPGLTIDQLESSDGVLTGCALGIAQTGTIVLDCGPFQGRRILTLLPDYHLCVVREDQVVGLVPEAVARLDEVGSGRDRPPFYTPVPLRRRQRLLQHPDGNQAGLDLRYVLELAQKIITAKFDFIKPPV